MAPHVIKDMDTLKMWYTGYTSSPYYDRIGYAVSLDDGITWVRNTEPVLIPGPSPSWDSYYALAPCVIKDVDTLKMWYAGTDVISTTYTNVRIGYATSMDGENWAKHQQNPVLSPGPANWDSENVGSNSVLFYNNTYHMWYTGNEYTGNTGSQIGYATSSNGINWTKHVGNPVFTGSGSFWDAASVYGPHVIKDGDTLKMWYTGSDGQIERIGYAISTDDGLSWQADILPVLDIGAPGQWDYDCVQFPCVIMDGLISYMWYDGYNTPTYLNMIGLATDTTSQGVINVPADVPTIQAGIDSASDGYIVLVNEGTYYENINFKGKTITVASRYLVDGDTSHISNTIIDGSQPTNPDSGSVVYFVSGEDTNSVLCGFTITGGSGTIVPVYDYRGGGGIYCFNSGCCIESNRIVNNFVTYTNEVMGGGIGVDAMTPPYVILKDNQIINNTINGTNAAFGGGMEIINAYAQIVANNVSYNQVISSTNQANSGGMGFWSDSPDTPYVEIKDNVISHNSATGVDVGTNSGAGSGGLGIFVCQGIIHNNVITHNVVNGSVDAYGAGIGCGDISANVMIDSNYVAYNEVRQGNGWGGGISVFRASLTIIKNIFFNNSVTYGYGGNGGGIEIVKNSQAFILNNTISANIATNGGGIYLRDSDVTIVNTILWGDSSTAGHPEIDWSGGSLSVSYSNIAGFWGGTGNIDVNPMIYDSVITAGDTTFCCLKINSPCVDSGDPNYLDPEDPLNHGFALWPAMGTIHSDMGAHGGIEISTGVIGNERKLGIPSEFTLYQNYPNPFNPTTTIQFDLPKNSEVILKVFNILGEEVAMLVSDRLSAGSYSYEWNASNLASGVYLYRLQAGDYFETKKMVVMR
jgi:predicted GH43/DUF377 family glycosyl hydrolase